MSEYSAQVRRILHEAMHEGERKTRSKNVMVWLILLLLIFWAAALTAALLLR